MSGPPFVIFGLPRSRTFWLSRFLTYGDWTCGHDELRHARSMEDVDAWLSQPCSGTVETIGAPWWRLLRHRRPDARIAVVRRPVGAVVDSLAGLGFDPAVMRPAMERLDHKLDQIERRVPGVLSVSWDQLSTEAGCAAIFEHCLPCPFDPAWWRDMAGQNLQIDMRAHRRYVDAHLPQIVKLGKTALHLSIAAMRRDATPPEGVTFQVEDFETFLRDGEGLFKEHLLAVGEAPDNYMNKNIPMMRLMETIGAMQIVTARSNGRMFGYLMAVLSPSLESEGVMSAMHMTFYADPSFRGLGLKLQRESVRRLKERGVDEVFMRAGTRGSGPKLGFLYRRMGAEPFGELFKLELKETA